MCRKVFKEVQKGIKEKIKNRVKLTKLEQDHWDLDAPDCDECLETLEGELLLPGNQDAWRVYQATQNQVIVAPMGGLVSINQLAVWEWIDRYEIKDPVRVFEQVCRVSSEMIADQNDDARLAREAKAM